MFPALPQAPIDYRSSSTIRKSPRPNTANARSGLLADIPVSRVPRWLPVGIGDSRRNFPESGFLQPERLAPRTRSRPFQSLSRMFSFFPRNNRIHP